MRVSFPAPNKPGWTGFTTGGCWNRSGTSLPSSLNRRRRYEIRQLAVLIGAIVFSAYSAEATEWVPFDEDIPENVVRITNDEDAPVICRAKGKRGKRVVGLLNEESGSCGRVTGGVQLLVMPPSDEGMVSAADMDEILEREKAKAVEKALRNMTPTAEISEILESREAQAVEKALRNMIPAADIKESVTAGAAAVNMYLTDEEVDESVK